MSRQILAIDIRNHAVAAILLNTGLKSSSIENCAYLPFPADAVPAEALRITLAELLTRVPVNGASVVVALPADKVLYRSVNMPFKEDKKIRQVLPFELEPGLPVAVENLVIDYQRGTGGGSGEVLAVAIEKPLLQEYLDALSAAGLPAQLVVPGGFAMANSLQTLDPQMPEHALVLDVDDRNACLFALVSGKIAMVRTLPVRLHSDDRESAVEAFAQKIRQSITAFAETVAIEFNPSVVYVCGPALHEAATLQALNRALELPTHPVDFLAYLPKVGLSSHVTDYTPWRHDNALALALIEAGGRSCPGFHRSSSPLRDYWIAYRALIRFPAITAAVVLLLAMGGVLLDNHLLQNKVNQLDAAIVDIYTQSFPAAARTTGTLAVEQMRSRVAELKKGGDGGQSGMPVRNMDVLLEISRLIPPELDVVLDRLMTGDSSLTVSGETPAFNVVDDVKGRLSGSPLFKQVTIASANMDKAGNKVRFKLKIDL